MAGRPGDLAAAEQLLVPADAAHAHAGHDSAAARDGEVDAHMVMEVVVRHGHRQRKNRTLAGGVGRHVGLAVSRARPDVDDRPATLADHVRQYRPACQVGSAHVDGKDPIEQCLVGIEYRSERPDRSVVDESVDAAEASERPLDHAGDIVDLRDVRFKHLDAIRQPVPLDLRLQLFESPRCAGNLRLLQAERDDAMATPGKLQGYRFTQAECSARDNGDRHHVLSWFHAAAALAASCLPSSVSQSAPFM